MPSSSKTCWFTRGKNYLRFAQFSGIFRNKMKGFVPTPRETVDTMVDLLFRGRSPTADNTVLDPGCGTGEFIGGVIRWCQRRRLPLPRITGVESDPCHLPALRAKDDRPRAASTGRAALLAPRRT